MAAGNKKERGRILLAGAVILLIGSVGAFLGFRRREAPIAVQMDKVVRRDITEVVVANGRIQPVIQVVINPEVSGEIIELPVKEGQQVQKGDLILKIKPDFYVASRNQAQAGFESSRAGKETAEANLRKAEAEFKRSTDLFRNRLISDSVFDEAKAAYDVALAQAT